MLFSLILNECYGAPNVEVVSTSIGFLFIGIATKSIINSTLVLALGIVLTFEREAGHERPCRQ